MECNRKEAIRAKELAIEKFSVKEYSAAKSLALKAQSMCPDLEGIAQFLVVLDVFISSEAKIGGETDWYVVLGVSSSCDEATIKKRYKAMALVLHPDKNRSVGSTDAFKLMSDAYKILSDRKLRAEHDAKMLRCRVQAMNKQPTATDASANSNPNNVRNERFTSMGFTNVRPSPSQAVHYSEGVGLFWTFCKICRHYFQYGEIFQGSVLVCTSCMNPFVANKVFSSQPGGFSQPSTSHRAHQNRRSTAPKDGPSSSNTQSKPDYFHRQQGFGSSWAHPEKVHGADPNNFHHHAWAHGAGESSSWAHPKTWDEPRPGTRFCPQAKFDDHQGTSSHGNRPTSSRQTNFHYDHRHWQQHSSRTADSFFSAEPESAHGQGSDWAPPRASFGQMNMGSGPSFYNWSGSNLNLNLNFGSDNLTAPVRTDENNSWHAANSMKRNVRRRNK